MINQNEIFTISAKSKEIKDLQKQIEIKVVTNNRKKNSKLDIGLFGLILLLGSYTLTFSIKYLVNNHEKTKEKNC